MLGFGPTKILLKLKLRKDHKTKNLLLLKLGIKVYRMITERYIHFNPLQKTVKYYFTSNLSERVKTVCRMITERYIHL
jgi:hypothetical protein